jgi:hypothetical protein|tara:strand:- start:1740 stop:1928 length:189 start_codon:yes stop_codon:yes gene_type:complete
MGARKETEISQEKTKEDKTIQIEDKERQPNIVEVEINTTLLNNKLNYLISKIDELSKNPNIK